MQPIYSTALWRLIVAFEEFSDPVPAVFTWNLISGVCTRSSHFVCFTADTVTSLHTDGHHADSSDF